MDLYRVYKKAENIYATIPQRLRFFKGKSFPPLQIVFELTYRCNLSCGFCYQRREEDQLGVEYSRDELTFAEIKSIIEQTPRWALIIFSGGEPFVRKDIMDILHFATSKRRCHIVTNGTRITSEIAKQLVDMGVTSVGISIEGQEEVQDRVRGRNTFAKATAAAQMLVDYKKKQGKRFPLVNLKTTITGDNVEHLSTIVDLTDKLGANYCSFQILNTSVMISGIYFHDTLDHYRQPPPPITDFSLDTLEKQLRLINEHAAKSDVIARFAPAFNIAQIKSHYANQSDMRDYTCMAPWTGMNISAKGEVFPCFNYYIGSLREQRLMELWNSERYRNFRLSLLTKGQFAGCRGCCDLVPKSSKRL